MSTLQMNSAIDSEQQTDSGRSEVPTGKTTPDWRIATDDMPAEDVLQGNLPMNLNDWERIASLGVGVVTLFFLARRLLIYLILAGIGAYLIVRGMTGHCTLYARANLNTRRSTDTSGPGRAPASASNKKEPVPAKAADDEVTEASRESFPASDPPAFYR